MEDFLATGAGSRSDRPISLRNMSQQSGNPAGPWLYRADGPCPDKEEVGPAAWVELDHRHGAMWSPGAQSSAGCPTKSPEGRAGVVTGVHLTGGISVSHPPKIGTYSELRGGSGKPDAGVGKNPLNPNYTIREKGGCMKEKYVN